MVALQAADKEFAVDGVRALRPLHEATWPASPLAPSATPLT